MRQFKAPPLRFQIGLDRDDWWEGRMHFQIGTELLFRPFTVYIYFAAFYFYAGWFRDIHAPMDEWGDA